MGPVCSSDGLGRSMLQNAPKHMQACVVTHRTTRRQKSLAYHLVPDLVRDRLKGLDDIDRLEDVLCPRLARPRFVRKALRSTISLRPSQSASATKTRQKSDLRNTTEMVGSASKVLGSSGQCFGGHPPKPLERVHASSSCGFGAV